jgi:hypothetical protein
MNRRAALIRLAGSLLAAGGWSIATAADRWVDEHAVGPFVCRSEFRLHEVRDLLDELTTLQTEIEQALGVTASQQEIELLLFRNRLSYVQYVGQRIPEGSKRPALYVKGPNLCRVYAYRYSGLAVDVKHEATHAILHNSLPYVPLWLDEGLAEYFEVSAAERKSRNPHQEELSWAMRFGWKSELKDLESKRSITEMKGPDYRDAWGWVHFLLHGPQPARDALRTYLSEIDSGAVPTPLSESLASRIPNLRQAIIRHHQRQ